MLRKALTALLLLGVTAALFAGGGGEAAGEGLHIVIATDATWPPMEMVNESKEIVGFDIDLMMAAAEAGGFTVEFKNTAWDGIFAGLAAGEYDAVMSSVTITEERQKTMDFGSACSGGWCARTVLDDVTLPHDGTRHFDQRW